MMRDQPILRDGFTLTEVMVVLALSAMVTLGILAFYLTAQQTWTDSSSQAIAQRDATNILESMADQAHVADLAVVAPGNDPASSLVVFYKRDTGGNEIPTASFFCGDDSLLHQGIGSALTDVGPITQSQIRRFHASYVDTLHLLVVDSLRVRSTSGQEVTQSSAFGLYN